ncbi:histidinol-phosphate transaminase [Methylibium sp.]|uniref:histidinol-phosphate transaminase n=1 Tax=Methylibium sp. TaxID=2067992 RepID=UPI003D136D85
MSGSSNGSTPLAPRLARFIRQDVQNMHAYAIQPSDGFVKLDAMENPHRLTEALQAELGRRLGALAINRYPGTRTDALRAALARHAGMPVGCALMLGNGSDELISLLSMACDVPPGEAGRSGPAVVLAPVPGFVMYEMSARLQGLRFVGVPLTADFELDAEAMLAAVCTHRPAITYLAYPNNPTANLWDDAVIERIVDAVREHGGLVVMDEAYQPFASRSYIGRLNSPDARHDHVLLMRTLSKFGLAGVRLGYLMGPAALVAEIDKVRPPYNVSVLNCEAALFALEHEDEFARQAGVLRAERARLLGALRAMPGATPFPSEANMVLVRVPDAKAAFEGLKARGVLVKNVSGLHPLLANCLRLTVGLPDENDQMIAALKGVLS